VREIRQWSPNGRESMRGASEKQAVWSQSRVCSLPVQSAGEGGLIAVIDRRGQERGRVVAAAAEPWTGLGVGRSSRQEQGNNSERREPHSLTQRRQSSFYARMEGDCTHAVGDRLPE
jgi:hypothetical protein